MPNALAAFLFLKSLKVMLFVHAGNNIIIIDSKIKRSDNTIMTIFNVIYYLLPQAATPRRTRKTIQPRTGIMAKRVHQPGLFTRSKAFQFQINMKTANATIAAKFTYGMNMPISNKIGHQCILAIFDSK